MIYGGLGMEFIIKENENHQLESIVNQNDKYKMNWVAIGKNWGEMFLPDGITGRIERTASTEGKITEKYIFVNNRNWEYFPQKGEIGIAVPFSDNYTAAEICMRERCHAHIRCGESQSYIAGIRMGGEKPNLGLVLKEGKIECYSIIRNEKELSNDRGTIILNPKINNLKPEERIKMQKAWQINIDASISSTINLPYEATVEDVYNIYVSAWKNNLKGITIYRDGCKRSGVLLNEKPKENKKDNSYEEIEKEEKINEEETEKFVCPECGNESIIPTGGCGICLQCGYSKCN
mgnify:CR=1 FL=1